MIFYWLIEALRWLVRQLKPPKPGQLAQIDTRMKCPVCGVIQQHPIRCVVRTVSPQQVNTVTPRGITVAAPMQDRRAFCQHTCSICGARWFQAPIAKIDAGKGEVLQSIPRDENEKAEDREQLLATQPPR